MARKSLRLSSSIQLTPKHKRAASGDAHPNGETKRSKSQKATPTKSQYFEQPGSGVGHSSSELSEQPSSDQDDNEDVSDFGDQTSNQSESEVDGDDDDYESEERPKPRSKSQPQNKAPSSSSAKKNGELWRPGVKTGLGPGTQVIIKKPKPRPAGKTPYTDETIHPNTLLFLKDLKANNERQWLKSKSQISFLIF
jgi:hypothetical protein